MDIIFDNGLSKPLSKHFSYVERELGLYIFEDFGSTSTYEMQNARLPKRSRIF